MADLNAQTWTALSTLLKTDKEGLESRGWDEEQVSKLVAGRYFSVQNLLDASRDGLRDAGIAAALADTILKAQGPPAAPAATYVTQGQLQQEMARLRAQYEQPVPTSSTYVHVYNQAKRLQAGVVGSMWQSTAERPKLSGKGSKVPKRIKNSDIGAAENTVLIPCMFDTIAAIGEPTTVTLGSRRVKGAQLGDLVYVNTHDYAFLAGTLKPDIVAVPVGMEVNEFNCINIVEVLKGGFDTEHEGKMFKYLEAQMYANRARPHATGLLTNTKQVKYFEAQWVGQGDDQALRYWHSGAFELDQAEGWCRFVTYIKSSKVDLGWVTPKLSVPAVQDEDLQVTGLLGVSKSVRVWSVQLGQDAALPGRKVACKEYRGSSRASSYQRELTTLQALQTAPAAGITLFPALRGFASNEVVDVKDTSCKEHHLLVTEPIVQPATDANELLVRQLFHGFKHLHTTLQLVFRDLERKHVGVADGQPKVIDCSACVPVNTITEGYSGTLICASKDVLLALRTGAWRVPARRQQDVVAIVKTLYLLIHHEAAKDCQVVVQDLLQHDTGEAMANKIEQFWDSELNASTAAGAQWQEMVEMAHVDEAGAQPYEAVMAELEQRICKLVRAK